MNINLTLIGQSIAFLFFIWFCKAFVWEAIRQAMTDREGRIADGLEAADRAEQNLVMAKKKAAEKLREAKQEAAQIIEAAHKRAITLIDEAKDQAREEVERIKVGAQADIEQDINRAKEQLRVELSALVLEASEKVLEASIDRKAHTALVEDMAARL